MPVSALLGLLLLAPARGASAVRTSVSRSTSTAAAHAPPLRIALGPAFAPPQELAGAEAVSAALSSLRLPESLDAVFDAAGRRRSGATSVPARRRLTAADVPAPAAPSPPSPDEKTAIAAELDASLAAARETYRHGSWKPEVQAVSAGFAAAETRYDAWRQRSADEGLDARFAQVQQTVQSLKSASSTIERFRSKDPVPPEDVRLLDQQLRALGALLLDDPLEADAVVNATIARIVPPAAIAGDINWQIDNAINATIRSPGMLGKYRKQLNQLKSAVALGMWTQARETVEHFFDQATPKDRFVFDPRVIFLADVAEQLHPFGNWTGQFYHSLRIIGSELRAAKRIDDPKEFERYKADASRGLASITNALPLDEAQAKGVLDARNIQRRGDRVNQFASFLMTLTPITAALVVKVPVLGIGLTVITGVLPLVGKAISGYGNHREKVSRADDRNVLQPLPTKDLMRMILRKLFRRSLD